MDLSDFQFLRAIDFIEDSLTRDIPLAEMARAVDVPPQRLADGFAAETGCSIDSFRAERRVGIVQQLLRSAGRDMTIGQIAPKVGFADTAALDAVFRAHLGTSINNYRAGRLGWKQALRAVEKMLQGEDLLDFAENHIMRAAMSSDLTAAIPPARTSHLGATIRKLMPQRSMR